MNFNYNRHINKKKNFGLTKREFDLLMQEMKSGSDVLFEQIFVSHSTNCINYLMKHLGISYHKSYDVTMETLIDFRRMLLEDRFDYGNLRYLFTRMAKFKALAELRSNKYLFVEDMNLFDKEPEKSEDLNEELIAHLRNSIKTLTDSQRNLLELHYCNGLKLVEIATQLNEKVATIRKRKQRLIEVLKANVKYT